MPKSILFRRSALLALLALVASALTPYGPQRLLFPFFQAADPGSTALSPEMWPITAYSSLVLGMLLFGAALLAWGLWTAPGVPLWLIAFSVFSVVISLKSIRFIDFTAVALLFVYAQRDVRQPVRKLSRLLAIPLDLVVCTLILFTLFMDVFSALASYNELRAESRLATHALRYASDMAEFPVASQERRVPVLCGLGAGSYISFPGHGNYRPLLDSGLSHFDSDTKRYFFFTWLEPQALAIALEELHVDVVLLDPDTFSWIPTLHGLNDWEFVTCSANGMLWKRAPAGLHPLSAADQAEVREAMAQLRQRGNALAAFDYSTLVDPPTDSLTILAEDHMTVWKETFFNSLCGWVDAQTPSEIQEFLSRNSCEQCPLLGAILAARLGPEAYDHFIAAHPKVPATWYAKAIATQVLLRKGDLAGARRLFDSISPVPVSSTTYYRLWHAVHAQDQPAPKLSAYGQWQSWDASAQIFLEETTTKLNDVLSRMEQAPGL